MVAWRALTLAVVIAVPLVAQAGSAPTTQDATPDASPILEPGTELSDLAATPGASPVAATPVPALELERPAPPRSADPLRYRLGGARAAFEQIYGNPTSRVLSDIFPFGDEYRPAGFAAVDAFYHKELVYFVRLTADGAAAGGQPGGTWTVDEAELIVRDVLPTDVRFGDELTEASTGRLVGGGHSRALESIFGRATYQQYGAIGDRGDVHYLFVLDDDGRVSVIELRVGSSAAALTGFTADEQRYLDAVDERVQLLVASVRRIGNLYSNPQIDATWQSSVRAELVFWRLTDDAVRALPPPTALAEVHADYLAATALYAGAADDLTDALTSADQDRVTRAVTKMRAAAFHLDEAGQGISDVREERQ